MGHDRRMLDQTLHAAQTFGQGKYPAPFQKPDRTRQIPVQNSGHHTAAAPVHLRAANPVAGMGVEARIENAAEFRSVFQPSGDLQGVGAMAFHADRQGLQSAQHKKGIERAGDTAGGVLEKTQALRKLIVADHDGAADHVGMAVEILRRRMHDDVDPQFQGPLNPWRGEGIVDRRQNPPRPRKRCDGGQIHEVQHRIAGGFQPDQPGVRMDGGVQRPGIAEVRVIEDQPRRSFAHLLEQAGRAAIKVPKRQNPVAGIEQVNDRRGCRHPRRECKTVGAAFEIGDTGLVGVPGRIGAPGVLIALGPAGAFLGKGRGGVDGGHHRTGPGIRRLSGVDHPRVE